MIINYNGQEINILIEYKKRKSISIKIDYDLKVRVLVPKEANQEQVMNIVESKLDLISKKLYEIRTLSQKQKIDKTKDKQVLYMGKKYSIKINVDKNLEKNNIFMQKDSIIVNIQKEDDKQINSIIESYLKRECLKNIKKRILYHQSNFKSKPKSVKVVESNKFWGLCSSNRDIQFNWKLIMAPIEVIDYVIIHEMSHMAHMNHSKSFWKMVAKIMPEYKKQVEWLGINGSNMNI